ncbi:MAG: hypothetical protein M0P91_01460 [Sulfuricurvum sp.]|jgi:hypothetical protein|uniref:hypothetical protein n=1 Tax=Sulfuricurvum sp. TaxID=2025608 RepID=UPI0025DAD835|nr:hypothetical protein [Sulfuricurvum sp.]MCK9371837.1 hypothetical protein [Sulfuricurvum sp.]
MTYRVEVKNPCRCFLRSGMAENESFETADTAKAAAEAMVEQMERDFCKKHDFVLTRSTFAYTITIVPGR